MSEKSSITNAIIKHLTSFAKDIKNKIYDKTQVDNKLSTFDTTLSNTYIKSTDFEKNVTNRVNTNTQNLLYQGEVNVQGECTLLDSIENYDYLIVYMYLYDTSTLSLNSYRTSMIINVQDNVYYNSSLEYQYRLQVSNGDQWYIDFSFLNKNTLILHKAICYRTNYKAYIYQVQGIKI